MFTFTKTKLAEAQPVEETDQDRLAIALREFRQADLAYSDACLACARYNAVHKDLRTTALNGKLAIAIGAMSRDKQLLALELRRGHALGRRNQLLHRWSELKSQSGG